MDRLSSLLIIFFLLILASCGEHQTSTSSMLFVTDKGHSKDYKEYWIKAYDPNNRTKKDPLKIIVKEEMIWNLIENKKYFASYEKEGTKTWTLIQIEKTE